MNDRLFRQMIAGRVVLGRIEEETVGPDVGIPEARRRTVGPFDSAIPPSDAISKHRIELIAFERQLIGSTCARVARAVTGSVIVMSRPRLAVAMSELHERRAIALIR